jgi:hypothetical protein
VPSVLMVEGSADNDFPLSPANTQTFVAVDDLIRSIALTRAVRLTFRRALRLLPSRTVR